MPSYRADSGPCDPPAETIAIALSDRGGESAWTVDVYVTTDAGRYWLGRCDVDGATAGLQAHRHLARIVAMASCPGATRWEVVASSTTEQPPVDVAIVRGACCASSRDAGVRLLEGGRFVP